MFDGGFTMKEKIQTVVDRRRLLGAVVTGATATAAASAVVGQATAAESTTRDEKRRARYQPNSPEVEDFYRVNGYPPRSGRSSC
jgi:hypothetical protein